MLRSFKGKSNKQLDQQQNGARRHSCLLFPFPLYKEMKRSFMLFPLVALFIAVWRFISWFHLRFHRLVLGKPLKCVSDSKQSFSCFLSVATVASSLMIKKNKTKKTDFQSELSSSLKPKPIQCCPKEERYCPCYMSDMKEEHSILFVISLISIISAEWMNFKWLAASYLCFHAWVRFSPGFSCCWWVWPIWDAAARWWSDSWFRMRRTEQERRAGVNRIYVGWGNTLQWVKSVTFLSVWPLLTENLLNL